MYEDIYYYLTIIMFQICTKSKFLFLVNVIFIYNCISRNTKNVQNLFEDIYYYINLYKKFIFSVQLKLTFLYKYLYVCIKQVK